MPTGQGLPYEQENSVSISLYQSALRTGAPLRARYADGSSHDVDVTRWCGPARGADNTLLARLNGNVLDVGCGPGRLAHAAAGVAECALGIDIAPAAVRLARAAGANAVLCSVFGNVPDAGSWDWVLLVDGNIGIGGNPARLLSRCAELVAPTGLVHVELAAEGGLRSGALRLVHRGAHGEWFPWSTVGIGAADEVAAAAGMQVRTLWSAEDEGGPRWFAVLAKS